MAWPKGKKRGAKTPGSGRKVGEPNKVSGTAKENMQAVFEGLGGVDWMLRWAQQNETEFARLYARLVPLDTHVSGSIGSYQAVAIPVAERAPLDAAAGAASTGDIPARH